MLTLGVHTRRFETLFQEFTGGKYAIAVSNGTSALEIIIRALDIEGKSIIVPTNTFLASALAVAHAGNKVVFADSDHETLSLDVDDVAKKIDDDTAAVMVVHIGGIISPEIHRLRELCESRGIHLIEDCAHAHGSTFDGTHAGLFGAAGGFSFFPTKSLTTGEGGMVITDNRATYEKALMLRNQGKNPTLGGRISEFGHNWRISEITAVMGVQQMEKSQKILDDRRRIARFYDQALQEFQGFEPVEVPQNSTSSYYKYMGYLDDAVDRSEVKRIMKENYGVNIPGEVYADLCHTEPVWDKYTFCGKQRSDTGDVQCVKWPGCGCGDRPSDFQGAEYISKHHLCLPMYPGLTDEELKYVIQCLDRTLHEDLGGA
jgi:dTDP-4-amino-4,6-dideoxygalactose transaminase